MPTIKIVPFPGAPGPQGLTGPTGPSGTDATFDAPGSWTPVMSGTGFTQSSNIATGKYIKYGQLVTVYIDLPFTNVTNFGTGQYSFSLPFASLQHTDVWGGTLHDASTGYFYSIKGHLDANSSTVELWYISSLVRDEVFDYNSPVLLSTADRVHLQFTYMSAS